jgi:hypothetical protein
MTMNEMVKALNESVTSIVKICEAESNIDCLIGNDLHIAFDEEIKSYGEYISSLLVDLQDAYIANYITNDQDEAYDYINNCSKFYTIATDYCTISNVVGYIPECLNDIIDKLGIDFISVTETTIYVF